MIDYDFKKADNIADACRNLYEIITLLRSPEGCPWDRIQDNKKATQSMIDESYEYLDGVIKEDVASEREEIGDVMINVFMNLYIHEEKGEFRPEDAINEVCEKLIRRHPHVFTNTAKADDANEVLSLWNSVKEKVEGKKDDKKSFFSHIPSSLPPLEKSYEIQKKLAKVGFDWDGNEGIIDKIKEELDEAKEALENNDKDNLEKEIGDLLFAIVNFARFKGIRPNVSLSRTNEKVENRFQYVIKGMEERGIELSKENIDMMNNLWEESKKQY